MNPIQLAIAKVNKELAAAGRPEFIESLAKQRLTVVSLPPARPKIKPMASIRQVAKQTDIPQLDRRRERNMAAAALKPPPEPWVSRHAKAIADRRDEIERLEAAHLEAEERRARRRLEIARCEAEIRANQSKPPDGDWQAEKELLLAEEDLSV